MGELGLRIVADPVPRFVVLALTRPRMVVAAIASDSLKSASSLPSRLKHKLLCLLMLSSTAAEHSRHSCTELTANLYLRLNQAKIPTLARLLITLFQVQPAHTALLPPLLLRCRRQVIRLHRTMTATG